MGQALSEDEEEEVEYSQIQMLYTTFMRKCPSGALHLHEFRNLFGVQSSSKEESLFMETIFKSFDTNRDNVIDFMEFVAAVHLVLRGQLEDRLKWSFKVYDRDGNGRLDRQEVQHIVRMLYTLKRSNSEVMTATEICDRIFDLVDQNKDGQISLSEFMEGAHKDTWIMELLKLDINASGWFKQHWNETWLNKTTGQLAETHHKDGTAKPATDPPSGFRSKPYRFQPDGKPICMRCNKAGHIARFCRVDIAGLPGGVGSRGLGQRAGVGVNAVEQQGN
ncbi:guanylyl cyclase-activating protein 2-like [Diretmus argenteus]